MDVDQIFHLAVDVGTTGNGDLCALDSVDAVFVNVASVNICNIEGTILDGCGEVGTDHTVSTVALDGNATKDDSKNNLVSVAPGGTYTITETVVPEGYNAIAPFEIVINWDEENGFTYEGTDYMDVNQNGQFDEGDVDLAQVTVVNKPGSTLPETGGIGTTLFYAAGALMVLAAVVLLVTKRRMNYAD